MNENIDLTNCDMEPIHVPGSVQAHGFLIALRPTGADGFEVVAASENAASYLMRPFNEILGRVAGSIPELGSFLKLGLLAERMSSEFATFLGTVELADRHGEPAAFQVVGHKVGELYILEFEKTTQTVTQEELNAAITNFVGSLERMRDSAVLCQTVTEQISRLTGFDRVMLYQFDDEGHGTVLAEDRNDRLPSYVGLRFPATDIPKQARALYVLNRVRIIPDVNYDPSPLVSVPDLRDELPLDLSLSTLRSVSPIHREYMRNMGTLSSMSISIVSEGKLWGLISGHNSEPRSVSYLVRSACDVLSRITSSQLAAFERSEEMAHAIRLRSVHGQLLSFMAAGENYIDGLVRHPSELFAVAGATSAAVVVGNRCALLGDAPSETQVLNLTAWISGQHKEEVYATNQLGLEYIEGKDFRAKASGVLAISLSQIHPMHILWFRPEIVETVHWAGEPAKSQDELTGKVQIHPRSSFASWKEIVRGKSQEWSDVEIESAREFRNVVLEIVLKRAEEMAELASELETSNKELEAFSYSVSHDLRAPFRHISGFAELLLENESDGLSDTGRRHLNTIAQSAQFAGMLVDSLLNFSKITRTKLDQRSFSMTVLAEDVWRDVMQQEAEGRAVQFDIAALPTIVGDLNLLRQVWRNLFSNSVKYTRQRGIAEVTVNVKQQDGEYIFSVKDNGVGFDGKYAHKLFGAFQRLHRMEDFEGTGIGLANVRRIIARHGGRTWAIGEEGTGATFFFTLPVAVKRETTPEERKQYDFRIDQGKQN